jgi:hypothetical protein
MAAVTVQHAFEVTAPGLVATFEGYAEEVAAWFRAVDAACKALHPQAKPYGSESRLSGKSKIDGAIGPRQEDRSRWRYDHTLDPVPEGWRWTQSRDCYRPRQGKVGQPARDWLDALPQHPGSPAFRIITDVGLPTEVWIGHRIYWPGAWVLDDALWIGYGIRLDAKDPYDEGTVRPAYMPDPMPEGVVERRLSEFHAAREAEEERRAREKQPADA